MEAGMCSGLTSHEMYHAPLEGEPMAEGGWVTRQYNHNGMSEDGGMGSGSMGFGHLQQSLSLSMSPGSQSSCLTAPLPVHIPPLAATECMALDTTKKMGAGKQTVHRKSIDTFGQRTSQYRGVTRSAL